VDRFGKILLVCTGLLSITGCSSPSPSTDSIEPLADSSCLLVVGAYDRWAVLDEEANRSEPGEVAARNFQQSLDTVFNNAMSLYSYEELLEANNSRPESAVGFSDLEVLAGIVQFRNMIQDNASLKLEDVHPGKHVTFDSLFRGSVKDRCLLREGSAAAQAQEKTESEISSFKSYSSYDEYIQAFVAAGGICDEVIEIVYCQSKSGGFQAHLWLWDEPSTEVPEKMEDMDIVYGKNWEIWINPELDLNLVELATAMGGKAVN
jgi:hypothetical protein